MIYSDDVIVDGQSSLRLGRMRTLSMASLRGPKSRPDHTRPVSSRDCAAVRPTQMTTDISQCLTLTITRIRTSNASASIRPR